MANKGWIKVHRQLQDCDIWVDEEPFDRRSAWIDLLLSCNHEDKSLIFDGHRMVVQRGQILTSVRRLSERWHWGKDRTLRFLRLLEELEMIQRESNARRTLLTVVKYEVFQDVADSNKDTDKDSYEDTDKDTREDTHKDTDKPQTRMIKNDKNEKNNNRTFQKPTVEEVRTYCQERGNNVDPETFVNFYESKGWMIGKNKMKSWKSAVNTWEKSESRKASPKKPDKPTFNNFNGRKYDFSELESIAKGGA